MTKDQFWGIIGTINQSEPVTSGDEYEQSVLAALEPYSLEDILDWQRIMTLYNRAAERRQLYENFIARGPQFIKAGFDLFRFWLISCGKEIYFDMLRNPEHVKSISEFTVHDQWKGRCLLFISDHIYDKKHKLLTGGKHGYLFVDIDRHQLSDQTKKDIQEELLREAPPPPSPIVEKPRSPSHIAELIESGNFLYGYVDYPFEGQRYVFFNTPGNIAHFLANHCIADNVYISDANGDWILNAEGWCDLMCRDNQLKAEIEKTLIPIKWGEVEPEQFFCPTYEEVKPYLEQQAVKTKTQGRKYQQKQPSR